MQLTTLFTAFLGSSLATTALAGTTNWILFSEAHCSGSPITTVTVGTLNEAHTLSGNQIFQSVVVNNVAQDLLGQNPPVHGVILNSARNRHLSFSLTNNDPQCHTLTDSEFFGIDNNGGNLGISP